eukprot:1454576-Amphidinium_carterae.1
MAFAVPELGHMGSVSSLQAGEAQRSDTVTEGFQDNSCIVIMKCSFAFFLFCVKVLSLSNLEAMQLCEGASMHVT